MESRPARVLAIDALNTGQDHSVWNSTVLLALSRTPSVDAHVLLDEHQLELPCFRGLRNERIQITPLPLWRPEGDRKAAIVARLRHGYRALVRTALTSAPDVVLLLAADNTLTPIVLPWIVRRTGVSRHFVFIHSNLEQLASSVWKRRLWARSLHWSGATSVLLAPFLRPVFREMVGDWPTAVLANPTVGHLYGACPVFDHAGASDFIFVGRHAEEAQANGFLAKFIEGCARHSAETARRITIDLPTSVRAESTHEQVVLQRYERATDDREYLRRISRARFAVVPDKRATELKTSGIVGDLLTVGTPFVAPNVGVWPWQSAAENRAFLYNGPRDLDRIIRAALTQSPDSYARLRASTVGRAADFDVHATSLNLASIIHRS